MIRILRFAIAFIKKKNNRAMVWPGSGCWNVEVEIANTAQAYVHKRATFRNRCVIRVRDEAKLSIGEFTNFNNGCVITARESIKIGDRVSFGPNVMIFDNDHDFRQTDYMHHFVTAPIVIEDDVWVGANVTILKGAIIRKGAVIGANSVVRGEVAEDSVYTSLADVNIRRYTRKE